VLLGLSVYSGQPDNTDRCSRPEVSAIRGFHCNSFEGWLDVLFSAGNRKELWKNLDENETRRASSRGLIPKAKVKTVKMTFVVIFGKYVERDISLDWYNFPNLRIVLSQNIADDMSVGCNVSYSLRSFIFGESCAQTNPINHKYRPYKARGPLR